MKAAEPITPETKRDPETKRQRIVRWIASGVALFLATSPIWFLAAIGIVMAPRCDVEVLSQIKSPAGYKLEVHQSVCGMSNWSVSVVASQGFWGKEGVLFEFDPAPPHLSPPPKVTSAGPDIVRISVPYIYRTFRRVDEWQGLKVDYDIGYIEHPGPHDPPRQ